MMKCEIESNAGEVCAKQEICSAICRDKKERCSILSQEDVIGLAVIAAFLVAAANAAVSGHCEFVFLMVVPILFSALVGFLVKKICVRLTVEGTGITAFLHRIYVRTIAAPFQKL